MTPHILLDPELLHLFDSEEERNSLCLSLVAVLESLIRSDFNLRSINTSKTNDGTREMLPGTVDLICENISPKIELLLQKFLDESTYIDKMEIKLSITRHRILVCLSPKYYTGLSSSIH